VKTSCTKVLWKRRALTVSILALLATASAIAEPFVSFNGKFQFTYPPTWKQVDYRTADYHLSRGRAAGDELNYEAVFADSRAYAIFSGQYLILTVDTIGALDDRQVDSVLEVMGGDFGRKVSRMSADSFLVAWNMEDIAYDATTRSAAVISELEGDETGPRMNALIMRFYEHGIANFFFYCPKAEFEAGLPVFKEMVASLSTENLQQALKTKSVKVAEVDDSWSVGRYAALIGGLVVLLVIILAVRSRRGRAKNEQAPPSQ